MVEPPSSALVERLRELRLCTAGDLRRCRTRVKRLAADLPAFDSVWIDALVQSRLLTPFQGRVLDSPNPDRLGIGPCVLVDEFGRGPAGATYLARHRDGKGLCVLKLTRLAAEALPAAEARLRAVIDALGGLSHPSLVAPRACQAHDGKIVTVSRYVPGVDLAQLLVRRGRFRPRIVWEIARQLLDGLAMLEEYGFVHGDVRPSKIRLTSPATVVLVDAALRPACFPELTIHDRLPLDRCDSVAPELIGTGQSATSGSDLYSLGCVLWHLLSGRPPFPAGDALTKLASHQTRDIPDIRQWAPDTPAALAEAIRSLTARDPQTRPHSFHEVLDQFGPPRRSGRRILRRFRAEFNAPAPHVPESARLRLGAKTSLAAAGLFVLSGLALMLFDEGARNQLLRLQGGGDGTSGEGSSVVAPPPAGPDSRSVRNLQPLPGPNSQGVIELPAGSGPYEAAEIHTIGPLVIRGTAERAPTILIAEQPLSVTATQFVLENVRIRQSASGGAGSHGPLLKVHAGSLVLNRCRFGDDFEEDVSPGDVIQAERSVDPAFVRWQPIDAGGGGIGEGRVIDSLFFGQRAAIRIDAAPKSMKWINALKLGSGPLLLLDTTDVTPHSVNVELERVTLRESSGLLQWMLPDVERPEATILIGARDSVLHVAGGTALVQFFGSETLSSEALAVQVDADGTLVPGNLIVASVGVTGIQGGRTLKPDQMHLEGLTAGRFVFAGPPDDRPANSVVTEFSGPRRSPTPPGIDPGGLLPSLR